MPQYDCFDNQIETYFRVSVLHTNGEVVSYEVKGFETEEIERDVYGVRDNIAGVWVQPI